MRLREREEWRRQSCEPEGCSSFRAIEMLEAKPAVTDRGGWDNGVLIAQVARSSNRPVICRYPAFAECARRFEIALDTGTEISSVECQRLLDSTPCSVTAT